MAAVDDTPSTSPPPPVRPPPLTQSDAITSLLSLSIAAADGAALPNSEQALGSGVAQSLGAASSMLSTTTNSTPILPTSVGASSGSKHHRRLGSMGKTKRRLSDAREASVRPILGTTPTSSAALSLAALSLSTSASAAAASPPHGHAHSHSLGHAYPIGYGGYTTLAPKPAISGSAPVDMISRVDSSHSGRSSGSMEEGNATNPIPIAGGKTKKRGVEYKCESCNKIYRHPNCLNKHRWEHTRQWREASKFVLSKHQQVQLLEAAAILSFMGKDPTSLPEDRSEWPTFLSGGRLPKVGDPDPEDEDVLAPPYGSIGHGHYPQKTTPTTKTYALQPISSSVPNPSGPRMHDYTVRASGPVQVAPGLLGVRTPTGHAIIGGPPVSRSVSGASSSRRSDSKSTASSGSASEDVDIDIDIDIDGDDDLGPRRRRRRERDIEVDVEGMEEGDVDEEEGRGVVSVRPMSRVRWEKEKEGGQQKQQPHVASRHDAFQGSHGLSSAGAGYGYGYAPSSYSSTGSVGYSPGYGMGSYGARRNGVAMKREEDEMSVSFSVREEDEEEAEEEEEEDASGRKRGWSSERRWDGMEMEVDMDMD